MSSIQTGKPENTRPPRVRWPVLSENACKEDELIHWQAFLYSLPRCSYLALYFQDSVPLMREAMLNDFGCEPISALRKMRTDALAEVSRAIGERDQIRKERDQLQQEVLRLRADACKCRAEFKELADGLNSAYLAASRGYQNAVNTVNDSHLRENGR
jgi:hypothetical protein